MANKIYQSPETVITWRDSGGDNAMTLVSLAAGAGRQGALGDLTDASRPGWFRWRFFFKTGSVAVLDDVVSIYMKTSDGTHPDNDDGTGDIAVSSEDKLKNLHFLGALMIDEAASGVEMVKSGSIWLPHRWASPVIWNGTSDVFSSTAAENGFDLTPIPDEIQ